MIDETMLAKQGNQGQKTGSSRKQLLSCAPEAVMPSTRPGERHHTVPSSGVAEDKPCG